MFLKIDMKGFICTCNGNEKQCIRESYNILNEYADRLYGEEEVSSFRKFYTSKIDKEMIKYKRIWLFVILPSNSCLKCTIVTDVLNVFTSRM